MFTWKQTRNATDWAPRESFAQYTIAAMAAKATGAYMKKYFSAAYILYIYRRRTYS